MDADGKDEVLIEKLSDGDEDDETVTEITYLKDVGEQILDGVIDKRKILRNGAWEYFEVFDEEQKIATCNVCKEQFSFRTTSTNLARHLQRKHGIEFEKVAVTDDDYARGEDDSEVSDDKNTDKRRTKSSIAWEYFTVVDPERRTAACKICHNHFSYLTSVSNLVKHVKAVAIVFTITDKRRTKSSIAWEYFTVADPERRTAACKICHNHFSYLTSVSNLVKHVKCKHGFGKVEDDVLAQHEEEIDLFKPESKNNNRSSVWLYFKCIDNAAKISVCLICKKQLSHLTSITNLKKHLFRKHPGIQLESSTNNVDKKMLISSDGQLYEIEETSAKQENGDNDDEQTEPLELNAIYLDNHDSSLERKRRKRKFSSKKRTYLDETTGVTETISSDEEITLHKRYIRNKNDSLEQFGLYIVSLLKQLPAAQSARLQAQFVQQALNAQLQQSNGLSDVDR